MQANGVKRTWFFERGVLGGDPGPLPAGNGDVVYGADVACAELVVAICEVAVGEGVVAVGFEALGVPDLVCHVLDVARSDVAEIEKGRASR